MSARVVTIEAELTPSWYATCTADECFKWSSAEFDYIGTAEHHAQLHNDRHHDGKRIAPRVPQSPDCGSSS